MPSLRGIVSVCVRVWTVGDRVVTQTWGLRVRSTTTSDDAIIMMRLIATRSVGVSPSLFHCSLVLFRFLSRDTRYECTPPSFPLFLSLCIFASLIRVLFRPYRDTSRLLFRPHRQLLSPVGITLTR